MRDGRRVFYDALGTNEIMVRCRCADEATVLVLSLRAYMKLGNDGARCLADTTCAVCARMAGKETA